MAFSRNALRVSSKVFAICGPPGSGKTSLCKALNSIIPYSHYVSMDDYQQMTSWTDSQLVTWLESGSDYSDLPMPGLMDELYRLKYSMNNSIPKNICHSTPIFFESHLGRHQGLNSVIDHVLWLDTALDISLARAVRAMFCDVNLRSATNCQLNARELDDYLAQYVARTAKLLRIQSRRIRPTADLIISKHSNNEVAEWIANICRK
jgi:uridine kinase